MLKRQKCLFANFLLIKAGCDSVGVGWNAKINFAPAMTSQP